MFRVEYHNGSDVFLMAQFFLGWCRVGLLTLNVFKVLGFHVAEGLVLQQHVIHEFIPLDTSVGVSVNLHEQLIEFFIGHLLADNIFE